MAIKGGSSLFETNSPDHIGIQFHDLEDWVESSVDTMEKIRKRIAQIRRAKITVAKQEQGPPTGAPINIEIVGERFEVLGRTARQTTAVLEGIPFVRDIRDDYNAGAPTLRVDLDRQHAAMLGLSTERWASPSRWSLTGSRFQPIEKKTKTTTSPFSCRPKIGGIRTSWMNSLYRPEENLYP